MITYHPDAKALVYQEINFISMAAGKRIVNAASYDCIFEEAAQEIYHQFVANKAVVSVAALQPAQGIIADLSINDMIKLLS
jgi:DeoR/GlpR family transcriptional regulator of sugar metabolism